MYCIALTKTMVTLEHDLFLYLPYDRVHKRILILLKSDVINGSLRQ